MDVMFWNCVDGPTGICANFQPCSKHSHTLGLKAFVTFNVDHSMPDFSDTKVCNTKYYYAVYFPDMFHSFVATMKWYGNLWYIYQVVSLGKKELDGTLYPAILFGRWGGSHEKHFYQNS
jgi:hypothetical protein